MIIGAVGTVGERGGLVGGGGVRIEAGGNV